MYFCPGSFTESLFHEKRLTFNTKLTCLYIFGLFFVVVAVFVNIWYGFFTNQRYKQFTEIAILAWRSNCNIKIQQYKYHSRYCHHRDVELPKSLGITVIVFNCCIPYCSVFKLCLYEAPSHIPYTVLDTQEDNILLPSSRKAIYTTSWHAQLIIDTTNWSNNNSSLKKFTMHSLYYWEKSSAFFATPYFLPIALWALSTSPLLICSSPSSLLPQYVFVDHISLVIWKRSNFWPCFICLYSVTSAWYDLKMITF